MHTMLKFRKWIDATKEGRVDGPTAWDGYVGQVTAKAASKARDTQTVVKIEMEEKTQNFINKDQGGMTDENSI